MDTVTAKYVERYETSRLNSQQENNADDKDDGYDSDALLDELENELENDDSYLNKYRESRMNQLSKEINRSKKAIDDMDSSAGLYKEITDEGELIRLTSQTKTVVILFYNPNFKTCKMLDNSLETLSYKHIHTSFYKIEATNAPFLATRLSIKVLPCIVMYRNGLEVNRVVGLQGLINGEDLNSYKTENLESLLLMNGILERKAQDLRNIRNKRNNDHDDDYE
ncbi:hypothetical protein CANARDRAFT_189951, partial [[Candida] arabinofermentans NRRL YB-2248]